VGPRIDARSKNGLSGFTVVELLVAIGVLAILGAVILSVFTSAREKARQTTCLSNLRQLAIAVRQYAQDNNDIIPPYNSHFQGTFTDGTKMQDHGAELVTCLTSYVHDRDIWFCPSDIYAHTTSTAGYVNHRVTSYATSLAWYAKGWVLGRQSIDYPGSASSQASRAQGPVLFTDALWGINRSSQDETPPPYWHNGRFNDVMFDGHVRSIEW